MIEDLVEQSKGWRLLEHTADIRMEVTGSSLKDLFVNAANGLTSLLRSEARIQGFLEFDIQLEGSGIEDLLITWLREILFHHETRGFLLTEPNIGELSETFIKARLKGGTRNPRDPKEIEIKGVTYHGVFVKKTDSGYSARVIFDI